MENAAAMCCFLSPKYQDSVACKDELTYAKEQRICIIPILLIPNWKPTGWLGFSITGLKWINFRDVETNMDIRMQQLVSEIQVKAGDKLNCFHDVQMLTSIRDTKEVVENQNKVHSVPNCKYKKRRRKCFLIDKIPGLAKVQKKFTLTGVISFILNLKFLHRTLIPLFNLQ